MEGEVNCILAPPQDGALFDRHILVFILFYSKNNNNSKIDDIPVLST